VAAVVLLPVSARRATIHLVEERVFA
jgi:hypothetical protein